MQKVTSKDGTKIAYEKTGSGPAVILVTGAFMDHTSYADLPEALAKHFTVFSYDRRGHGESTDTLPYAVEREIEDIDALIQEAGGPVFLYGTSSGAALAFEAASHGLSVKGLAMYEPPYSVDHAGQRNPTADTLKQLKELIASDRRGDAVKFFMTDLVGLPAGAAADMEWSPAWAGLQAVAHTVVYDAIITSTASGDFIIPTKQLAELGTPTLVMDGGASWDWIRDTAKAVADAIPGAEHRTLEGQEHGATTEVLAPVLTEFFEKTNS